MEIPKRRLGTTGFDATIFGLGGEGVLRTFGRDKEATRLIERAIDHFTEREIRDYFSWRFGINGIEHYPSKGSDGVTRHLYTFLMEEKG